jgi:hypothetical protein
MSFKYDYRRMLHYHVLTYLLHYHVLTYSRTSLQAVKTTIQSGQ